jgi:hypothetical protein
MNDSNDNNQIPTSLGLTREQAISDALKRTEKFREEHPDFDWKGGVIEPTMNMVFDLRVCYS